MHFDRASERAPAVVFDPNLHAAIGGNPNFSHQVKSNRVTPALHADLDTAGRGNQRVVNDHLRFGPGQRSECFGGDHPGFGVQRGCLRRVVAAGVGGRGIAKVATIRALGPIASPTSSAISISSVEWTCAPKTS